MTAEKKNYGCKGCYYENKNIDKDIEILKDITRLNFGYSNTMMITEAKHKEIKQATENVLDELKNLQEDLKIHEETSFDFQAENIKLRKELEETIKELNEKEIANKMFKSELELEIKDKMIDKMAEYLWKHLYDAEKMYICNGFNINMETCACMEEEENKCKEKIKEQFRNEVLKDE